MKNDWEVATWGDRSFTVLNDTLEAYIYGVFELDGFEVYKAYRNQARIKPSSFEVCSLEEAFTKYPEAKEIYLKECIKRI